MKRYLVAAAIAALLAAGGCTTTVDLTYLIAGDHYTTTSSESRRSPQTIDSIEYETAAEPDGSVHLACFARTRQVKHNWQVTRTYRYRGGYGKPVYQGTALLDVIFGAAAAGTFLALCRGDDPELSCWNMLYATVFAADLGYAGIRYLMAKPPLLMDKSSTKGPPTLADPPLHEQTTDCESLASLWLGAASGAGDVPIGDEPAKGAVPRALAADSLALALARTITLTPEAAERWALQANLRLFAVDRDGIAHPLAADRCAMLSPLSASLSEEAQAAYTRDCIPDTAEPDADTTEPDADTAEPDEDATGRRPQATILR